MSDWLVNFIPDKYYEQNKNYEEGCLPNIQFKFLGPEINFYLQFKLSKINAKKMDDLVNAMENKEICANSVWLMSALPPPLSR